MLYFYLIIAERRRTDDLHNHVNDIKQHADLFFQHDAVEQFRGARVNLLFLLVHCLCNDAESTGRLIQCRQPHHQHTPTFTLV